MTAYAGIALLVLAAIIAGAFALLRSRLTPARIRRSARRLDSCARVAGDRSTHHSL